MATTLESINVSDKSGKGHLVILQYSPSFGIANAYHEGELITMCRIEKPYRPRSDSDSYWELYTELMGEWFEQMKKVIIPKCIEYFNRKL